MRVYIAIAHKAVDIVIKIAIAQTDFERVVQLFFNTQCRAVAVRFETIRLGGVVNFGMVAKRFCSHAHAVNRIAR